jgi:hypothetical protein
MTSSAVVAQYSRSTFPPGCWMMTAAASAAWQLPIVCYLLASSHQRWWC